MAVVAGQPRDAQGVGVLDRQRLDPILGELFGHEALRRAGARDDDFLAGLDPRQQAREVGLRGWTFTSVMRRLRISGLGPRLAAATPYADAAAQLRCPQPAGGRADPASDSSIEV
jgi:hypothetical protein